ncbi:MAG: hypothetical protein K8I82_25770 [Anaerolineae bacterium]|nr:hypothetical protein [Anaerolineae bacterium]
MKFKYAVFTGMLLVVVLIGTGAARQSFRQIPFQRVAWSHDGETIAVASATGIRLFDAETLERVLLPDLPQANLTFSPDDRLLALTDGAGSLWLWDVTASEVVWTLEVQADQVAFSPDGTLLLSTGFQEIRLWDVATSTQIHRMEFAPCVEEEGYYCGVVQAAFSPDGKSIVTLAVTLEEYRQAVWQQWDVETWEKLQEFVPETVYDTTRILFNPNGKNVVVGDGIWVWIWDVETNTVRRVEQVDVMTDEVYDLGHQWGITTIAYSADGSRLASAGYEGTLQVYDSVLEKEITYMEVGSRIDGLALSPDGALVALVTEDGVFQIWDAVTGELLHTHKTEL